VVARPAAAGRFVSWVVQPEPDDVDVDRAGAEWRQLPKGAGREVDDPRARPVRPPIQDVDEDVPAVRPDGDQRSAGESPAGGVQADERLAARAVIAVAFVPGGLALLPGDGPVEVRSAVLVAHPEALLPGVLAVGEGMGLLPLLVLLAVLRIFLPGALPRGFVVLPPSRDVGVRSCDRRGADDQERDEKDPRRHVATVLS